MDPADLLPHRPALIGAAVALVIGLAGGLVLKIGPQSAQDTDAAYAGEAPYALAEPIAWPSGKVPDYVVGTDFLSAQRPQQPPVIVASYEVPEYIPTAWTEPAPEVRPVRLARVEERTWPSTSGDILNTRLPEDAPTPVDAPEAPQAIDAPEAPDAPAPVAMAAAY